jgi:hypothetical protein
MPYAKFRDSNKLYDFSPDAEPAQDQNPLPVDLPAAENPLPDWLSKPFSEGTKVGNKIFGTGGEERYQFWPERMIREGLSAAHDVTQPNPYPEGSEGYFWYEDQRDKNMLPAALSISALAGTGGLAGTGTRAAGEAVLGSSPILRPALKIGDKIYKGKPGQEHLDVLPPEMYPEFQRAAMAGEDLGKYEFGFMNHKGQFLDREKALDYGIEHGLVSPDAKKYGVLTSTLYADSSKPGVAIEALKQPAPQFYSAVEHTINNAKITKATPEEWLGYLRNQPGVKQEELQWLGLDELKGPITKQELERHIQDHKVELKEVNKVDKTTLDPVVKYLDESFGPAVKHIQTAADIADARKFNAHFRETTKGMSDDEVLAAARATEKLQGVGDSKYHSYQLPGGENYKEMLLTLPNKQQERLLELEKRYNAGDKLSLEERQERHELINQNKTPAYSSSHWDEPNVLAHIRMNDRNINGKKTLHIEEIQSDWHQQGRKSGYKGDLDKLQQEGLEASRKKLEAKEHLDKLTESGLASASELDAAMKAVKQANADFDKAAQAYNAVNESGVPNAPFKKDWDALALKRMIRHAAEKGYDQISWTPGEAQAARYDLSKSIDKLKYNPDTQHVIAFDKNGNQVLNKMNVEPKDLPDVVGKEVADKLINAEVKDKLIGGTYRVLENADLKVGGEGMKGFYDKMLVDRANALGKKFGAKVEKGNLPGTGKDFKIRQAQDGGGGVEIIDATGKVINYAPSRKTAQEWIDEQGGSQVHVLPLTQGLKDTALQKGFPLFSAGVPFSFTPVQHDPFKFTPVNHDPFESQK